MSPSDDDMQVSERDFTLMGEAFDLACAAAAVGEVPVGAIVVQEGHIIGRGHNRLIADADPSAHAEIVALREAGRVCGAARLPGCRLYVTLEPCLMCLAAMIQARVERLVFGARDAKLGASDWIEQIPLGPRGVNHRLRIVGGPLAAESAALLRLFFQQRRSSPKHRSHHR